MTRYWLVCHAEDGTLTPHPDPVNLAGFWTASQAKDWADGYDAATQTVDPTRSLPWRWFIEPKPEAVA